jgi:hypothetical protein
MNFSTPYAFGTLILNHCTLFFFGPCRKWSGPLDRGRGLIHVGQVSNYRKVPCFLLCAHSPVAIIAKICSKFFIYLTHGVTESTWYCDRCLAYCTSQDDRWWWWWCLWNEYLQRKPKYSEKTCPSATSSTTNKHNLTWARTRQPRWESSY